MRQKIMVMIFAFYIFTVTCEAPIRWCLSLIGLSQLLFVRDVFIVFALIYEMFIQAKMKLWYLILFFSFFFVIGIFYTQNLSEVLWGLKTYLPFIFGFAVYRDILDNSEQNVRFASFIFIVSCIGVGLNYIFENPFWQDISGTDLGSQSMEGVRTWYVYVNGEYYARLSGFTRISNTVSNILLYTISIIIVYKKKKMLYLFIGLIPMLFTLTKVNIAIYFLFMIFVTFFRYLPQEKRIAILKITCSIFVISGISLPLLSLLISGLFKNATSDILLILFASFDDRLINSWPGSFELVFDYGNYLLGRGLGGLGVGVMLFDSNVSNTTPIDNFYLYTYGNFGIIGICMLLFLLKKILFCKVISKEVEVLLFLACGFLGIGIMQDMSDQISLMCLGVIVGFYFNNTMFSEEKLGVENV